LRIAAPNEARAIQRAVESLRAAGVRSQDVLLYLNQLLLEALNRTAEPPHPNTVAHLREVSERLRSSRTRHQPATDGDLYLAIAQFSNNPALKLFVRVLLAWLPATKHGASLGPPEILDEMLAGIMAGDAPKARRAFLQYTARDPAKPARA
jgi:DNA-binding FadR family transcriptional regulator